MICWYLFDGTGGIGDGGGWDSQPSRESSPLTSRFFHLGFYYFTIIILLIINSFIIYILFSQPSCETSPLTSRFFLPTFYSSQSSFSLKQKHLRPHQCLQPSTSRIFRVSNCRLLLSRRSLLWFLSPVDKFLEFWEFLEFCCRWFLTRCSWAICLLLWWQATQ